MPRTRFSKFDIAKNCKAEVAESAGIGETFESAMRDEEQARQQLIPQLGHFTRENKTTCIREAGLDGTPSYVELQTCLEIADDNKARFKDK